MMHRRKAVVSRRSADMPEEKKLNMPWFKRGDIDAVLGVFFDGFSKIIVGIGVLTGVMGMSFRLFIVRI